MEWKKHGLIYKSQQIGGWAFSHAMVPTPFRVKDNEIRVFTTFCDDQGVGRVGFVDINDKFPFQILRVSKKPILDIGKIGTFDENGVICCSVVKTTNNELYMYYAGFELGTKIRYRLLTGIAISKDNGESFQRFSNTPILERNNLELYFRGGPFCIFENNIFKMWYVGGNSWINLGEKIMPSYEIKYIESKDGLNWPKEGIKQIKINNDDDEYGFGRPSIFRNQSGIYQMFYSIRKKSSMAYRLGYAESSDGKNWIRMDKKLNLDVSESGFDNKAIMYAVPFEVNSKLYLLYNGNNFGVDGFALASLQNNS